MMVRCPLDTMALLPRPRHVDYHSAKTTGGRDVKGSMHMYICAVSQTAMHLSFGGCFFTKQLRDVGQALQRELGQTFLP